MNESSMRYMVDLRSGGNQPPGQGLALVAKRIVLRRSYDSRGQAAESDVQRAQ